MGRANVRGSFQWFVKLCGLRAEGEFLVFTDGLHGAAL